MDDFSILWPRPEVKDVPWWLVPNIRRFTDNGQRSKAVEFAMKKMGWTQEESDKFVDDVLNNIDVLADFYEKRQEKIYGNPLQQQRSRNANKRFLKQQKQKNK